MIYYTQDILCRHTLCTSYKYHIHHRTVLYSTHTNGSEWRRVVTVDAYVEPDQLVLPVPYLRERHGRVPVDIGVYTCIHIGYIV